MDIKHVNINANVHASMPSSKHLSIIACNY